MTANLTLSPRPAGDSVPSSTPLATAITRFLRAYAGRDPYLPQRLAFWVDTLGRDIALTEITAEDCEGVVLALKARGSTRRNLVFIDGKARGGDLLATGKPLSVATVNRYVTSFLTLWRGCQKLGILPRSRPCPAKGLTEGEEEGRTRFLSRAEFVRLREHARASTWPRLEALIVLATTTALRRSSLEALRWRDIDLRSNTITVERTKSGRPHVAVLVPAARTLLDALPGPKEPDHLVFRGKFADKPHHYRKAWENARAAAGLADGEVCLHSLRHTAASWSAQAGHSPLEIAKLTGHRSMVSLRRYTHLDTSDLRRMSEGLFGSL